MGTDAGLSAKLCKTESETHMSPRYVQTQTTEPVSPVGGCDTQDLGCISADDGSRRTPVVNPAGSGFLLATTICLSSLQ